MKQILRKHWTLLLGGVAVIGVVSFLLLDALTPPAWYRQIQPGMTFREVRRLMGEADSDIDRWGEEGRRGKHYASEVGFADELQAEGDWYVTYDWLRVPTGSFLVPNVLVVYDRNEQVIRKRIEYPTSAQIWHNLKWQCMGRPSTYISLP